MKKFEQVEQVSDEKLRWKAQIFLSHRSWESTIMEQVPNERIVWRSKGDKGYIDGAITFHELAPNLTRVVVVLEYHPQGLFEKTGNLWRAQGRRVRLELKHFQRQLMTHTLLHPDDVEGWPGEIRDGEVVEGSDEGDDESSDESDESDESDDEDEDDSSSNGQQRLGAANVERLIARAPLESRAGADSGRKSSGDGDRLARRRLARPRLARRAGRHLFARRAGRTRGVNQVGPRRPVSRAGLRRAGARPRAALGTGRRRGPDQVGGPVMTTAIQPAGGGGGPAGGPSSSGLADVIDTILDKGLVIDAYVRLSLVGIELIDHRRAGRGGERRYLSAVRRGREPARHRRERSEGRPTGTGGRCDMSGAAKAKTQGVLDAAGEKLGDILNPDQPQRKKATRVRSQREDR